MNLSQLRREATDRIWENGKKLSRLVLIHAAVTTGVSLLLMLISWLSQYIAPEGGLSNMGTQTLLATGQTLLQLANMIAIPFWNAGLIYCTLRFLREQDNSPRTLTEGFRNWRPIASSLLVQGLNYFFLSMASSLASSFFISMLPLPPSLIDDLTAFAEAPVFPLTGNVRVFMAVYAVIYIASLFILLVPRLYLHRLAAYRVMDEENPCTGLQAVLHSRVLMKGNRRKLLLLDLSFWWFYLLEVGISVLSMGDLFLAGFGISLPIEGEMSVWVFPVAALLLRLVLYYYAKPKLAVSYAIFYQKVSEKGPEEPEPPKPKRMPWKY